MEPDGQTFDDPIVIKTSNNDVLVFDFPSSSEQTKPEALALNDTGDGLLLNHFSTLAVLPPGVSCNSESGWNATDDDAYCSDQSTATTLLSYGCKAYTYCLFIDAKCCVEPGGDAHQPCELGMDALTLSYTPNDGNSGEYAYCVDGSGGAGGAGNGAGGSGGDPGAGGAGGSGSGLSCFSASAASVTGTGADCNNPRVITLGTLGDSGSVTVATGTNGWSGTSACDGGSPVREDIFQINTPGFGNWNSIDVSVDAATGVNTSIAFVDSDQCTNAEDHCLNDAGTNACEVASATAAQLMTGVIFVVVSSDVTSTPITTNFRIQ
jgi:hypothetical protein